MTRPSPAALLRLAAFIGGLLLVGFLTGYASNPKATYGSFVQPSFAPPAWLFGPVWTVLYIMIAVVGWRLYEAAADSVEMRLWWAQLALNFLWTPVFFMLGSRALALAVILALLALIIVLIRRLWPQDRTGALLLVPYALWVAFATVLNAAIVRLN